MEGEASVGRGPVAVRVLSYSSLVHVLVSEMAICWTDDGCAHRWGYAGEMQLPLAAALFVWCVLAGSAEVLLGGGRGGGVSWVGVAGPVAALTSAVLMVVRLSHNVLPAIMSRACSSGGCVCDSESGSVEAT
jgi:hypothetical protein